MQTAFLYTSVVKESHTVRVTVGCLVRVHKQRVSFDLFFKLYFLCTRPAGWGKRAVGAFFGGQSSVVLRDAVGNRTLFLKGKAQDLSMQDLSSVYARHSPHMNSATSSAV